MHVLRNSVKKKTSLSTKQRKKNMKIYMLGFFAETLLDVYTFFLKQEQFYEKKTKPLFSSL